MRQLKELGSHVTPGAKLSADEKYQAQRKELVELRLAQELTNAKSCRLVYPTEDHAQKAMYERVMAVSNSTYRTSFYGHAEGEKKKEGEEERKIGWEGSLRGDSKDSGAAHRPSR